jgi:8-oxo-dGTP diphosphatase
MTPLLTVDGLIEVGDGLVLIRRKNEPFQGAWALPGGFVDLGETVEAACAREMREETSLEVEVGPLLGVYSDPGRDPRGHTVSAVFICTPRGGELLAADDAAHAEAIPLADLSTLSYAFDHGRIIADYLARRTALGA